MSTHASAHALTHSGLENTNVCNESIKLFYARESMIRARRVSSNRPLTRTVERCGPAAGGVASRARLFCTEIFSRYDLKDRLELKITRE
ncbi:hypothetical protein EVAR_83737_1 [Eumeta japonica]|uniref:Uncharacterized protein n=1 Tax=Eumeta variegata TaxID=151549 RepID=A0A4C1WCZ2_EUMVA|nr:hypothetical protein EVAR_83737_1 [Eumeta japonica]